LEAKFAEQLELPCVVVLPSARFGIWAGLRIVVPPGEAVVVPALNCGAVHEAAIRSGLDVKLVDCSQNSFFINTKEIPKTSAWILSELYGQTYDLQSESLVRPFCILDMAMTIPERQLVDRMRQSDLGLFSFGFGKPCYAGCGGIAVTRDRYLAQELRRTVRASCGEDNSLKQNFQGALVLGGRIIAHSKLLYGFARKIQSLKNNSLRRSVVEPYPTSWSQPGTEGKEWHRLPGRPELRMIVHNLSNYKEYAAYRRELESRYRTLLRSVTGIVMPPPSIGVLSHFTIRVTASKRELIRRELWRQGIDTGDIFGYPRYFDPASFPNAFRATEEIINLPMDRGVTEKHVLTIARMLVS
jgi:dTDP-4-amino-4,6-dideoxygalactose transaminase